MFFPAADTIAFAEGGVEAMRLDSSGNLGVGTTNPSGYARAAFVNAGGAALYAGGGTQGVFIIGDNSSRYVTYNSSGNLAGGHIWQNGNTEVARIDLSGNFLIGATTSRGLLTIGTPTSGATGSPASINLGGSYSNAAGQNLKLALYTEANVYIGFGVSDAQLDYVVKDNAVGSISHNWYTTPTGISTPTKRMQLNPSGALTIPNQPMLSLVHTVTESPAAGGTLVQWTGLVLTNCGYSSGVFTAQVAGRYLVCASLLQVAAGGIGGIYLRKNGSNVYRIFYCDDTTGYEMGSGQVIISLAVNDTLTLNQESAGITWYGDGAGLGAWTINLLG
jgi:hypothetical protein